MNQRVFQTTDFWQKQFQVTDEAIEGLYNIILETGEPMSIDKVGLFFVKHTLEEEERKLRSELEQGKPYSPQQSFTVNDKIVFSHLDYAVGTVVNTRPGYNPKDGDFTVLEVVFEEQNGLLAEFAADLKSPHALLNTNNHRLASDNTALVQKTYGQFQYIVRPKIEAVLSKNENFVEFNHDWFLADFLVEVQEGLLNIVDAAIDINGAPLNVDALIEHIELQGNGKITETMRFSVNHCLAGDDRFENVGTDDNILWYLNRLKPTQVTQFPRRLRNGEQSFDINLLDDEQRALLVEIDDETTPSEYAKSFDPEANSVVLVLNYPHRRLGTLPVVPAIRHLLPQADDRLLALQLIDGQTGDSILAWYVSQWNYIWGLEAWYAKYKLPVGAVISLTKTDDPLKLIIDFIPQRTVQEYVRVALVRNNQLTFEIRKRRLSCKYDELMIVGEEGSEGIDALWEKVERDKLTVYDLLGQMLPELMRLTAQGAVHIKTIYSAINILKRCSPGLLMQELITHDTFVSMGHGYWTYKPKRRGQ
jgi:hypothetical protein